MSVILSQTSACVALQNGDILKLDLEENFDEQIVSGDPQNPNFSGAPKIYKPPVSPNNLEELIML